VTVFYPLSYNLLFIILSAKDIKLQLYLSGANKLVYLELNGENTYPYIKPGISISNVFELTLSHC